MCVLIFCIFTPASPWLCIYWCVSVSICVCVSCDCCMLELVFLRAHQVCVHINLCSSMLPCIHCSLSLTQYAVWSCLQPHLSPSRDRQGFDSPKRSMFLADLHTWYLGGRGPLAGTLSCRWLLADRPCSPTSGPPLYRSGTCTHHSVPRPPGNVAWNVPHWCTQLAEWTMRAKASLI